ncbi:MAG TPA: GspH/FimT family pseudopilin [Steroidobacteraceae bacterium]|nr:GspH/FimT family pseudopilin [Steroidobacteraceae bacterium]
MRPTRANRAAGFTLNELMLVLAIAGVMVGIAIPNMRDFMWNNRMTSSANDLLTAVYRARSEAVKRHGQTILCFTSDSEADVPVCDGDGTQGWVVFADTDGDGEAAAGEEVVLRHGPLPGTISLFSKPNGNAGYVAFNNAGFARNIAIGTALAGVVMCDGRGNVPTTGPDFSAARGVLISPTGRPQVTRVVNTIKTNASLGKCPGDP